MVVSSTLPRAWVERIFLRLQGVYGNQFVGKFANGQVIDGKDVGYENAMQVWSEELGGFADNPDAIAYALRNLGATYAPSVLEFANLCRQAPKKSLPALEAPVADPVISKKSLDVAKEAVHGNKDMHAWAKRPRSQHALNLLLRWCKENDSDAKRYYKDLMERGHVDGATLVNHWDGVRWARA